MEQGYGYSISRVGALAIARPLTFAISSPIAGYVADAHRRARQRCRREPRSSPARSRSLRSCSPSSGAWVVAIALALSGLGHGRGLALDEFGDGQRGQGQ